MKIVSLEEIKADILALEEEAQKKKAGKLKPLIMGLTLPVINKSLLANILKTEEELRKRNLEINIQASPIKNKD